MQLNVTGYESVSAAKEWARKEIDVAAGKARARYLTVAPGQEATYTAKYQQALAFIAADYPSDTAAYPWIAAESSATGLTPTQTADRIKATGDAWANMLGPAIEGARIGGKDALEALTTTPEVLTSARATIAALGAI